MALVQGTVLYTSKLTWNGGQRGVPERHWPDGQSHAESVLIGSLGIIIAESGLTPARALLSHRQARFSQRLHARPRDGEGPEGILTRDDTVLASRLRTAVTLRPGDAVEAQERGAGRDSQAGRLWRAERVRSRRQAHGDEEIPSGRTALGSTAVGWEQHAPGGPPVGGRPPLSPRPQQGGLRCGGIQRGPRRIQVEDQSVPHDKSGYRDLLPLDRSVDLGPCGAAAEVRPPPREGRQA